MSYSGRYIRGGDEPAALARPVYRSHEGPPDAPAPRAPRFKKSAGNVLRVLLAVAVTVVVFVWLLHFSRR